MTYLNMNNNYSDNSAEKTNIKTLPPECRPDERLKKYGAEALSDAELLAVIIRTGFKGVNSVRLSERIIGNSGKDGLLGLCRVSVKELMEMRGVGEVKAYQIKAVAELTRRIAKQSKVNNLFFNSPDKIAAYYMEDMRHRDKECLMILSLNGKGALLGENILSIGTVNMSLASPREIFLEAFKNKAVSIVMMHNHPSGDPAPSRQDIELTVKIKRSGDLLGITLVDHIIIGDNTYVSLKEKNLM